MVNTMCDYYLQVRRAKPADTDRILLFCQSLERDQKRLRDLKCLMASEDLEQLYLVEVQGTGDLVAVGASCAHCDSRYVEIGGGLVNIKGFGLQRLLTHLRAVQTAVATHEAIVFCVLTSNDMPAMQRMTSLGFVPWGSPPDDLVASVTLTADGESTYLILPKDKIDDHWIALLHAVHNGRLLHLDTRSDAQVKFDIPLVSDPHWRAALEIASPVSK